MLAIFMAVLDSAIANVALPSIARDLNASPAASIWIVNGVGSVVLATGLSLLALLPTHTTDGAIICCMALCGVGFGFFQSPNNRAMLSSAPKARSGGAGGMQATARLLGQTNGAALVAVCFRAFSSHGSTVALGVGAGFAATAAVVSSFRHLRQVDVLPAR